MIFRLATLFLVVTLTELYLLSQFSVWTGSAVYMIALVLLTSIIGAWLAKQQGLSTLRRIQQTLHPRILFPEPTVLRRWLSRRL